MFIRDYGEYYLIKVSSDNLKDFNIFDKNDIKELFQDIFKKMLKMYDLKGLVKVDIYVNNEYGIIMELRCMDSYFDSFDFIDTNYLDEIDVKIRVHFNDLFLINIDSNSLDEYEDVYYHKGKFYTKYKVLSDSEVFYKNIDDIINNGIKIS